jgi:hypothetical protein
MKPARKVINIVEHKPTGAEVPVVVRKVNDENVITDYEEVKKGRKGFKLYMLEKRWDKSKEYVLELLKKYQVPAFLNHDDVTFLEPHQSPVDFAIFFEEYIYGIEKKESMYHNKLKSRIFKK